MLQEVKWGIIGCSSNKLSSWIILLMTKLTIKYTPGYIIPKGWKVLTWSRAIHHDPTYYSNPDEFNPSRWDVSSINCLVAYRNFKKLKNTCVNDFCIYYIFRITKQKLEPLFHLEQEVCIVLRVTWQKLKFLYFYIISFLIIGKHSISLFFSINF